MAKTREVKRRIRSVDKTRQITKTMEMVATSKLKRAQDRVVAARPYAEALSQVIGDLYQPELEERFPLLRRNTETPRRVALVLITSNRGLCGGFNSNLIKRTQERIEELESKGVEVSLYGIGKKGIGFFKYHGRKLAGERIDIGDRPTPEHAAEVMGPLMEQFEAGELDAVEAVYAHFISALTTPPTLMKILPVDTESVTGESPRHPANYILSPSADKIVEAVLPLYIRNSFYRALVETVASEQGARRTAMKNATDNAGEMLDYLRRSFNRARQAQITQEIAEIVGGAEAL